MRIYTNTIPFSFNWVDGKPEFLPVGTTFAAIGADMCGIIIEQVSNLNKGKGPDNYQSVNTSVFEIAFKEVEQLTDTNKDK